MPYCTPGTKRRITMQNHTLHSHSEEGNVFAEQAVPSR